MHDGTRKVKSVTAMAKVAFNMKKNLFASKVDLNLRKKLVECHIWSIALCGAETGTLRKVDQKYLGSFEMWCWRRMENISCTGTEPRNRGISYVNKKERRLTRLVTKCVGTAFQNMLLKERMRE